MPASALMPGMPTEAEQLISMAPKMAGHIALASRPLPDRPGDDYDYPKFAHTVQAAAAGLAWRGLRARDVVGVLVPDAARYLLATLAIRAAGGVPCPVAAGLSVAEMAGQLAEAGARMLITSPPLAASALAVADRSWVRQVFSFSEAAGTTLFSVLLEIGTLAPVRVRPDDLALLPFYRGPDGRLRPAPVTQADLAERLAELTGEINADDVVLAGPPAGSGEAYTELLDAAILAGASVVASPLSLLETAAAMRHGTVAIIPAESDVQMPTGVHVISVS